MFEFSRIKRLPPYVFAIVNSLKMEARRKGFDIIDLGMGNPDLPTPSHIVEKLCEAARQSEEPPLFRFPGHYPTEGGDHRMVQETF